MYNKLAKKLKFQKPPLPRSVKEITEDYSKTAFRAGQLQYRIFVDTADLAQENETLRKLNFEMAERNELDKKEAEKNSTTKEATNGTQSN